MATRRRRGAQPGNSNAQTHGRTTHAQKKLMMLLKFVSRAYPGSLTDYQSQTVRQALAAAATIGL